MGQHAFFPSPLILFSWVQNVWFRVDAAYWLVLAPVSLHAFFTLGTCLFRLVFAGPRPEF